MKRSLANLSLVTLLAGCGSSPRPAPATALEASASPAPAPTESPAPAADAAPRTPGPPTRAELDRLVAGGLGPVLARIHTTPTFDHGRFVGFRLDAADDLDTWRSAGADVRVGDVIVRVNGVRIERPEQALWAFEQLRIVHAIDIEMIRDGQPIALRVPIAGDVAVNTSN